MKLKFPLALCAVLLALLRPAFAQNGGPVSPEVLPDRRVTFRIAAPKATEVTFKGDWHDDNKKMEKDAAGVWSITVDALAPSTYIYAFMVDGMTIADPVNPRMKLRERTSASLVVVPGPATSMQEPRDVPHGAVEINVGKATALGGENRQVWIYTPPGYTQDTAKRYPVLYLLHGSNDRPAGWIDVGNVNTIADNLIAEKKMTPMIIVMPFGHALPFGGRGNNTTAFTDYLLRDVMPLAEGKYRIAAGRENRALAGFSMGAEQSLAIFFAHLDKFSAIGAFAPSGFRAIETQHAALLADPKGTNEKIALLWLSVGKQDPGHLNGSTQLENVLTAKQITHTWRLTDGMHNYAYLRDRVEEFLPLVFKPAGAKSP